MCSNFLKRELILIAKIFKFGVRSGFLHELEKLFNFLKPQFLSYINWIMKLDSPSKVIKVKRSNISKILVIVSQIKYILLSNSSSNY